MKFLIIRTNCDCASGLIAKEKSQARWKYGPRCPYCKKQLGPEDHSVVKEIEAKTEISALHYYRESLKQKGYHGL